MSRISALKLALAAKEAAKESGDSLALAEPIAVIGLGCRFPGGSDTPEAFWELLSKGGDGVDHMPGDRWNIEQFYNPDPDAAGKIYTRHGGFLRDVKGFDAPFFKITPKEADGMDPQQRLLLEVAWETLESAGIIPESLFRKPAGVFIGISTFDYALRRIAMQDPSQVDAYFSSGNVMSVAAGRLSYTLGLSGPAVAVDTACSSALVAVHQACQSLRRQECTLALAGGVGLLLAPEPYINFCRAKMLSPKGQCRSFDAGADGYVRGEGCGLVALKPLSRALADGDRIRAVIRGSAVNQDGASGGLTVPSGPSQSRVISSALASAMLKADHVDYLEAHGTGTTLGDPIEMGAVREVFKTGSRAHPLIIGSVKTNIGHLEAASGIAGLIKAILALEHGQIPAHLHFDQPNPKIDWKGLPIVVPKTLTPWPASSQHPLAGVSAFGFSGTNAHLLVEAPPQHPRQPDKGPERPWDILTLSARTQNALTGLAKGYSRQIDLLEDTADLCFSANTGRTRMAHTLTIAADSAKEFSQGLKAFENGQSHQGVFTSSKTSNAKIAFLFTGQGSQYVGMGKELYQTAPVFREALDQCAAILANDLKVPLTDLLYPSDEEGIRRAKANIGNTGYTQPVLFSLEYALATLWKSWGIQPAMVAGHSVGEYVAACIAGVFTLEEGLGLIAVRARLMDALPAGGAMVALFANENIVTRLTQGRGDVSVAAVNGPKLTVIAGKKTALEEICAIANEQGIQVRHLDVSHAFHSPLMVPVLDKFETAARKIAYKTPQIGLVSNVSGRLVGPEVADPAYWRNHIMAPVRFADSVKALAAAGCNIFIEIGPGPVLMNMGRQCLDPGTATWLPSMTPSAHPWKTMTNSLATLAAKGVPVDWTGFDQPYNRQRTDLPLYPFQREPHWFAFDPSPPSFRVPPPISPDGPFPLKQIPGKRKTRYGLTYSETSPPVVREHKLYGTHVVAGAAHITLVLRAFQDSGLSNAPWHSSSVSLENIAFHTPLIVRSGEKQRAQLILTHSPDGTTAFSLVSKPDESDRENWQPHATGSILQKISLPDPDPGFSLPEPKTITTGPALYRAIEEAGHFLGPSFRWIREIAWSGRTALCSLMPPSSHPLSESKDHGLILPGLIDACFQYFCFGGPKQLFSGEDANPQSRGELFVPAAAARFTLNRIPQPGDRLFCRIYFKTPDPESRTLLGDIHLLDGSDTPLITIEGLVARSVNGEALMKVGLQQPPEAPAQIPEQKTQLVQQLRQEEPGERYARLWSHVAARLADIIGSSPASLNPDQGLFEMGLDSLMAMDLKNRLAADTGLGLSATLVFDHPTLKAITDHLAKKLALDNWPGALPVQALAKPVAPILREKNLGVDCPIAIIGMGCRFPGGADSPQTFWELLKNGVDTVGTVPAERWDMDAYYDPDPDAPGKIATRFGAFLDGVRNFDADFFGISPREAIHMDPQQRLMLEVSWEALENGGIAPNTLSGSLTGVFAGISTFDYAALHMAADAPKAVNAYFATGTIPCMAAGRLSYTLGLTGPSLSVDTACSSSLVSLHLACQSLSQGECDMAIAGGVGLMLSPALSVNFTKARMLAPDGRCKTFDAAANGYVRGEGCGMVVLKPLDRALADKDRIQAVIRGSAVNQDGAVAGFTVPSGPAQEKVIRAALDRAAVRPDQIEFIEAHGTGTSLGDPIEAKALGAVFQDRTSPLVIGSVKTNIGHLEAAAGIAGVIKTVLSLNHGLIPPHLNFSRPNPTIPWKSLPLKVAEKAMAWTGKTPMAGVSGFGASGTNAHVILAAPPKETRTPADNTATFMGGDTWMLPLSAKTESALRQSAADYAGHLKARPELNLRDICHTAALGRSHWPHRLAVLGRNSLEIADRLGAFSEGRSRENVFSGSPDQPTPAWPMLSRSQGPGPQNPADLAKEYVSGRPMPWERHFEGEKISLPTYPFQRSSFWFTSEKKKVPAGIGRHHPLIQTAMAMAGTGEHRFETLISKERTPFIFDHIIHQAVVFPMVAGLEMTAHAAQGVLGTQRLVMEDIRMHKALVLAREATCRLQLVLTPLAEEGKGYGFELFSRTPQEDETWQGCLSGKVRQALPLNDRSPDLTDIHPTRSVDGPECYRGFRSRGIDLGPAFQSLNQVSYGKTDALGQIRLPAQVAQEAQAFPLHPVIWDACIQATGLLLPQTHETFLPVGIDRLELDRPTVPDSDNPAYSCRVNLIPRPGERFKGEFRLLDDKGRPLLAAQGLRIQKANAKALLRQLGKTPPSGPASKPVVQVWQENPLGNEIEPIAQPGKWLIITGSLQLGHNLARNLENRGASTQLVHIPIDDPLSLEGIAPEIFVPETFLQASSGQTLSVACILGLSLDGVPGEKPDTFSTDDIGQTAYEKLKASLLATARLVQALARRDPSLSIDFWMITQGAQALEEFSDGVSAFQNTLWGLARVIALEFPDLNTKCLDLDPGTPPFTGLDGETAVMDNLFFADKETETAIRRNKRYTGRLVPLVPSASKGQTPGDHLLLKPDATYLVTGGTGGLGLEVARRLVQRGARHLVLAGRRPPSPEVLGAVSELEAQGCTVACPGIDISDQNAVTHLFKKFSKEVPPLGGVIHTAGMSADSLLLSLDPGDLDRTLSSKVRGTLLLHQETQAMDLDFFVCFSSAAALLGSAGQASYASANAFMDGLIHHRRAMGLCGLSINWGPWGTVGMAARLSERARQRLLSQGFIFLSALDALDHMERLITSRTTQAGVIQVDWPAYLRGVHHGNLLPRFDVLLQKSEDIGPPAVPQGKLDNQLTAALKTGSSETRQELMEDSVQTMATKILELEEDKTLGLRTPLFDAGFDSLMAEEFRAKLEIRLGIKLRATLLFDFPTVEAIVSHLLDKIPAQKSAAKKDKTDRKDPLDSLGTDEIRHLLEQELTAIEQERKA